MKLMTMTKAKNQTKNHNVLALNKSMLPSMSRALKRIAEIVLENPVAVTHMTVEELAAKAACSEGTVIRWCKVLGFSGFQELKLSLAVDSAVKALGKSQIDQNSLFSKIRSAITNTEFVLSQDVLQMAAKKILEADTILIIGVGASAQVGKYLQYRLLRAGIVADFHSDMHTGLMAASILTKESVLIAVSNSGSTIDINEIAQCAIRSGAKTIALTNHPKSHLTKIAGITLLAGSSEDDPLAGGSALGVITQIAVIESLFELIISLDTEKAKAVLKTAESVLKRLY